VILAGCKSCKRTTPVYGHTTVTEATCCDRDMVGVVQCDTCLRIAAMPIDGRWAVERDGMEPERFVCGGCQ
jgi:hypothetical protein